MERNEMPIGFIMALMKNPDSMRNFSLLQEEKKEEIIKKVNKAKSKEEIEQYVNSLTL